MNEEQQARLDSILAKKAQEESEFSVMETVKNIPSSAMKFASDMAQPFIHPLETAKGLGNLGMGIYEKMPWEEGIGPHEQYADAAGQFYKDRYGSGEGILNTLQSDPIGMLSDLSLGLTGAGTAAKAAGLGGKLQSMGRAVDPVSMALNAPGAAMKGVAAIKDPVGIYQSAAKFPTTLDIKHGAGFRDRITQTALDEKAMPNPSGVAKIEDAMFNLDNKIEEMISAAGGNTLPASRAARYMNKLRSELDVPAIDAASDLAKANKVATDLGEQLERLGKTELTAREFQVMKRKAYKKANYDVKRMKDDPAVNKARKAIAKGAKEAVEELVPGISGLNAKYGDLIDLIDPLQRASGRIGNRDMSGIGMPIKIGAGSAAAGPLGGVLGGIAGLLDIPTVKGFSAIQLNKAKQMSLFDMLNRSPINYGIQQGLFQTGREPWDQ